MWSSKDKVLYVGSNNCHIQEKGKKLFHKTAYQKTLGVKHTVKQPKGMASLAYALEILI